MFKWEIVMVIDDVEYIYGADNDRNKANEIAMEVREDRGIDVYVRERK